MKTEQFILKLLDIVVWPLTVIVITIFFRKPLYSLIPFLKRLRYKDVELEFEGKLKKIKKTTSIEPVMSDERTFSADEVRELALSPRSTVIESWIRLEHSIRKKLKDNDILLSRMDYASSSHLLDSLDKSGLLDKENFQLIRRLRDLRNVAAHSRKFKLRPDAALEYLSLVERVEASIQ